MNAASASSMLSELLESEEDEVSLALVEEADVPVDDSVSQASVDVPVWDEAENSVASSAVVAELLWFRVA
jgi:hypothetical protein